VPAPVRTRELQGRRFGYKPVVAMITPYENGPYLVRGSFEITDQEGNVIDSRRKVIALCRCGASRTKPFCDGSHKAVHFRAPSVSVKQALR
jgi:CDGSH-type Zn-finger protein